MSNIPVLIALAGTISLLVALKYLGQDMHEHGALTFKASTVMFIVAGIAFFTVWAKPAQWEIGNYIILGIIAFIVVAAIGARREGR